MFGKKEKLLYVVCHACKHLFVASAAQEIKVEHKAPMLGHASYTETVYYCPEHKVRYDSELIDREGDKHFYKKIEVNEDGEVPTVASPHEIIADDDEGA